MDLFTRKGKKKTRMVISVVMLASLATILLCLRNGSVTGNTHLPELMLRFFLTAGLMYAVYLGKQWARVLTVILFSFGLLWSLAGIFRSWPYLMGMSEDGILFAAYFIAVYHFAFSGSFVAFQNWQQKQVP